MLTPSIAHQPGALSASQIRHRYDLLYKAPDYVKSANEESLLLPPAHAGAYADPAGRRFPCHNPAATWMSAAAFYELRPKMASSDAEQVESQILRFADYWRIEPEVRRLGEVQASSFHKSAAELDEDSNFGFSPAGGNPADRHLPLHTPQLVKEASTWLLRYRDEFPYAQRAEIAKRVLAKAASLSVELERDVSAELRCMAGDMSTNVRTLQDGLMRRASIAKQAASKDRYAKLAMAADRIAVAGPAILAKTASVIEAIDKEDGLGYTQLVARPEAIVFNKDAHADELKRASECHLKTGAVYAKQKLGRVPNEAIEQISNLLGDDFAKSVMSGLSLDHEKLASAAEKLEWHDASALQDVLSRHGVWPDEIHYRRTREITPEEWSKMASVYQPV